MNKKLVTLLIALVGTFAVAVAVPTPVFAGVVENVQPATYQGVTGTKYQVFVNATVLSNGTILGTYMWMYKMPTATGYSEIPDRADGIGNAVMSNTFGRTFSAGDILTFDDGSIFSTAGVLVSVVGPTPAPVVTPAPGVTYRGHVQNIGWQGWVSNGAEAGTTGQSLRVEALDAQLTNVPTGAHLDYQAYVQNTGWQKVVMDGQEAGTDGKALRIEALKMTLVGMPGYSVQYRTYVQNIGWQAWVADGVQAGTTGQSLRVEAVEVKVVKDAPIVDIDTPTASTSIASTTSSISVAGWSLNPTGVSKVQVYCDNTYIEDATINEARSDVGKAYPSYTGSSTSGYSASLPTTTLTSGTHALTIKSTGVNGVVTSATTAFVKTAPVVLSSIVDIDSPKTGTVITGSTVAISGWSLNPTGVSSVQVYCDNVYIKDATINGARPDVAKAYPGYATASTSGYSASIPTTDLSSGTHTLTVKSTGVNGLITSAASTFVKPAPAQ